MASVEPLDYVTFIRRSLARVVPEDLPDALEMLTSPAFVAALRDLSPLELAELRAKLTAVREVDDACLAALSKAMVLLA